MEILFLVFWGTSILFSIVASPAYIPTSSIRGSPFLHALPGVCRLFNHGHSGWCEVMLHCSFDLHFANNYRGWASFHVPVGYLNFSTALILMWSLNSLWPSVCEYFSRMTALGGWEHVLRDGNLRCDYMTFDSTQNQENNGYVCCEIFPQDTCYFILIKLVISN